MRATRLLWWLAAACASLLLIAPLTPRSMWLPTGRNTGGLSRITEGVGWLAITALLGGVALVALILSFRTQRPAPVAASGAAVATVAFVVTAVGMGRHWFDLTHGTTSVLIHPGEPWTLHPAPFVPHFAVVATVGALLTLALTFRRIWPVTGVAAESAAWDRSPRLRRGRPEPT